ncbi:MAG: Mpv17/PMP22 family protein [Verrucomicrobia bacterium]|nr:Mpv17/PMP22 family protein [Verrucomicrobiota bacterium]MCH8528216.1 Mpv17/PMP22 family protein [Kiritimatiellia bacterium]
MPAFVLQAFAGLILALYFLVPAARPAFEVIGDLRARNGYVFSAVSAAVSGGMVSWIVLWNRGRIPPGRLVSHGVFFILYWAAQGLMVDTLYRLQSQWFGDGNDPLTLFKKVLVDQGPYNLLYATPVSLFFYTWKDHNFSGSKAWTAYKTDFSNRYWSVMISAWMVWIPAVTMIYSLPPDLQIPLFNLVICFFTLVLAFISRETEPADPSAP